MCISGEHTKTKKMYECCQAKSGKVLTLKCLWWPNNILISKGKWLFQSTESIQVAKALRRRQSQHMTQIQ